MATKKISELPLITRVSGSQMGGTVLPVVVGGTTDQISVENFSKFITAYSAHTGSAGNTFTGPQIINSNVTINGRLTVTEVVAQYETASVIFSSGSNIFGDKWDDVHTFTGSVIYNGVILTNIDANTIQKLQQATASLNTFTSSQADRNLVLSTVTGSINQATASIQFQTASLLQFTASQDSRNFTLSQVTGSFNYFYQATASLQSFTASQADRNLVLSTVTGSINQATASLQTFTASQADRNLVLSIVTGSINQATASIQFQTASLLQFTASQDSRNFTLSQVTGSFRGEIGGLESYSASLKAAAIVSSSTQVQNYDLFALNSNLYISTGSIKGEIAGLEALTASMKAQTIVSNSAQLPEIAGLETYTASLKTAAIVSSSTQVQNYDIFGLNSNLYRATGSLIGITNGLMAFTASLDNTYATDAQLYQLYQATRSIELTTGSLIGITNGLMAFTASEDSRNFTLSQVTGSFRGELGGLEAYSASLKAAAIVSSSTQVQNYDVFALNSKLYTVTGSLIGITNGLMAFTAALDSTYATDAQLYQLYAETASIKAEIGGIEAYTASLKGAAIVSSSQQITNYYKFAETASANTFYGNQTFASSGGSGLRVYGAAGTHQWDVYLNSQNLRISDNTAGDAALVVDTRASFTGPVTASALNLTKSPDGIFAELGGNTPKLNLFKFSSGNVMNIGHNYYYDGTAYGKNDISLQGWQFRSHITNAQYTISFSPATVTTVTESININGTTGDLTISNGNLVMGTSGKGIDFSATANSGSSVTSEILNDYEAGTWTPTDGSGAGLTFTTVFGRYIKIGKQVTVHFRVNYPSTADATSAIIGGLPYVVDAGNNYMGGVVHWTDASMVLTLMAIDTTSTLSVRRNVDNTDPTNANLSTKILRGTVTYQTF